jgi:hypothetical protein
VLRDQVRVTWPDALVVSSRKATRLRSRSKAFTVLLDDPVIASRYRLARIFGDDHDEFNYWVYRRREPTERDRLSEGR